MDGTLVDTEPVAARALEDCFRAWGIDVDPAEARLVAGRKWEVAFEHMAKAHGFKPGPGRGLPDVLALYRSRLEERLPAVPGSVEAIRALSARFRLALVSGSPVRDIRWILDRLGVSDRFELLLGSEDYALSKPSPEGFLEALGRLGLSGGEALAFEDSEAGIAAAKDAGLWVAAITSTNHFGHDQSRADLLIADLTGIGPAWVEGLQLSRPT